MKKLLPLALLFASVAATAGEFSVLKSKSPGTNRPGPATFTMHRPDFADYPRGAYGQTRIKSIEWRTAGYPANPEMKVQLCFRATPGRDSDCEDIQSGSAGTVSRFNGRTFYYASDVIIRHKAERGQPVSHAVGNDTVIFHFAY